MPDDENDAANPEQPAEPEENGQDRGDEIPEGAGDAADAADKATELAGQAAAQADEGADMSDDEAAALASAMQAIGEATGDAASGSGAGDAPSATPFESPELADAERGHPRQDLDLLSDVHMDVRIELGRTRMFVEDVLKLGDGAVVELDKLAGDPVDVYVNDRKVAKGEVLVLNDNFCVRINEIVDLSEA